MKSTWLVAAVVAAAVFSPTVGDFNGDGRDDVVVTGDPAHASEDWMPPWPVRVVFGKAGSDFVDVRAPGSWGVIVNGAYGWTASLAGDVSGDGRADVLAARANGGFDVVLGRAAAGTRSGSDFSIRDGPDYAEGAVAVGDVNADGFDDLAAFHRRAFVAPRSDRNVAYLIPGGPARGSVDLAEGTQIRVPRPGPITVSGVGDADGDGIDDLAVGAPWYRAASCRADRGRRGCTGRVWLVYGRKHLPAQLDVTTLGGGATMVASAVRRYRQVQAPSPAGDLDGDGRDEMIVVARQPMRGSIGLVVWGSARRARVPLTLRTARIPGSYQPIGDFDGDGRSDLLGQPDEDRYDLNRFRVFILRGHRWSRERPLVPRGPRDGFLLLRRSWTGQIVAPGDVNGDGLSDLANPPQFAPDLPDAGWVIFGSRDRRRVRLHDLGDRGFRFGLP